MIKGVGLDIIELERIQKLASRSPKFYRRILTGAEIDYYEQAIPSRQVEFLAARFAVKEAFAKAMGTGIGKQCSFHDIEVVKTESGAPYLLFQNEQANALVSITHTRDYAAAQVIILS